MALLAEHTTAQTVDYSLCHVKLSQIKNNDGYIIALHHQYCVSTMNFEAYSCYQELAAIHSVLCRANLSFTIVCFDSRTALKNNLSKKLCLAVTSGPEAVPCQQIMFLLCPVGNCLKWALTCVQSTDSEVIVLDGHDLKGYSEII